MLPLYIRYMLEGNSIKKCAKLTGISIQTSFDWRHKILTALGQESNDIQLSKGIVESDDFYVAYSEKGKFNLTRAARKRGKSLFKKMKQRITDEVVSIIGTTGIDGNRIFKVACRGRTRKKNIEKAFSKKLSKEHILCTDSHYSYTAFCRSHAITHVKIKSGNGK
ncbi:MAG: IS1595 family transposase [Bacteroidales bacterium]|nr:IS1595 family transposase [Bacteroidales bacterium]